MPTFENSQTFNFSIWRFQNGAEIERAHFYFNLRQINNTVIAVKKIYFTHNYKLTAHMEYIDPYHRAFLLLPAISLTYSENHKNHTAV